MATDALEAQLAGALERFRSLQRRISDDPLGSTKLALRIFKELEGALELLRSAQERLVENRQSVEVLQADLTRQYERYWQLFDEVPLSYAITRADSTITEVNRAAAQLFNVSQRFLVGKPLSVFVGEDRLQWLGEIRRVAEAGGARDLAFRLRPRERAALHVRARVVAEDSMLRWVIVPEPQVSVPSGA